MSSNDKVENKGTCDRSRKFEPNLYAESYTHNNDTVIQTLPFNSCENSTQYFCDQPPVLPIESACDTFGQANDCDSLFQDNVQPQFQNGPLNEQPYRNRNVDTNNLWSSTPDLMYESLYDLLINAHEEKLRQSMKAPESLTLKRFDGSFGKEIQKFGNVYAMNTLPKAAFSNDVGNKKTVPSIRSLVLNKYPGPQPISHENIRSMVVCDDKDEQTNSENAIFENIYPLSTDIEPITRSSIFENVNSFVNQEVNQCIIEEPKAVALPFNFKESSYLFTNTKYLPSTSEAKSVTQSLHSADGVTFSKQGNMRGYNLQSPALNVSSVGSANVAHSQLECTCNVQGDNTRRNKSLFMQLPNLASVGANLNHPHIECTCTENSNINRSINTKPPVLQGSTVNRPLLECTASSDINQSINVTFPALKASAADHPQIKCTCAENSDINRSINEERAAVKGATVDHPCLECARTAKSDITRSINEECTTLKSATVDHPEAKCTCTANNDINRSINVKPRALKGSSADHPQCKRTSRSDFSRRSNHCNVSPCLKAFGKTKTKVIVIRNPKGPDGTIGFHKGRAKEGLKTKFVDP